MFKYVLVKYLSKLQEDFGWHHKNLTHIEGGLGSQILGVLSFYNQQDRLGEKNAKCDLSYFSHQDRAGLWDWSLSSYGIHIEELKRFESKSRFNLLKAKRDFLTEFEISEGYWRKTRAKYLTRFPIDQEKLQIFLQEVSNTANLENYGTIHIRRGDYLQVASKVIGLNDYLQFLKTINIALPTPSFIISDSPLTLAEKQQLAKAVGIQCQAIFLDGPGYDPFVLHSLMRTARLLVTSNSTYSFSAGLLGRQGQVVFSPVEFHAGKGSEKYNRGFRSVGSFTSWNLDNSRDTI